MRKGDKKLHQTIVLTVIAFVLFFAFSNHALAVLAKKCTGDKYDPSTGIYNGACSPEVTCCSAGQRCVDADNDPATKNRCARALEIVYPTIPGQPAPITVAEGIPQYFKYIFNLAVALIGLIIFGVFVYHGSLYLSSAGNVSKLADAKQGIGASFLGTAILLASYIIFTTINPQLVVLDLPTVSLLEQAVVPGVYVCNYEYPGSGTYADGITIKRPIPEIGLDYIEKEGEEQNVVVTEIQKIIVNPDDRTQTCQKVNFSGNFQNFVVEENDTMFVIPRVVDQYNSTISDYGRKPVYEYSVILHEKDDFRGKCKLFPEDTFPLVYTQTEINSEGKEIITDNPFPYPGSFPHPIPGFKATGIQGVFDGDQAKSITIFKKPRVESIVGGLTMHMCLDFDRIGWCPKHLEDQGYVDIAGKPIYAKSGGDPPLIFIDIGPGSQDMRSPLAGSGFGDVDILDGGMRSVKIGPEINKQILNFAILNDEKAYGGNCAIIKNNSTDITTINLNKCMPERIFDITTGKSIKTGNVLPCNIGARLWSLFSFEDASECVPCIQSARVIKGQVL